jgi:DNA invertase Pin-like site-specific DNA recombinase
MPIRNAAIYARVSLADGQQNADNQLIQLRRYCKAKGWKITEEYIDKQSGKRSDNRARFQAMMKDASQRRFDVVMVWALDRLSREGVHATFDHIKTLKGYGVEFESFQEQHFRTTGPAGELMIAIAAWIAEQERIRLVERTKAGLARARQKGRFAGRPKKVVDRQRVKQLAAQGLGSRAIATALKGAVDGGVSHTLVQRILRTA